MKPISQKSTRVSRAETVKSSLQQGSLIPHQANPNKETIVSEIKLGKEKKQKKKSKKILIFLIVVVLLTLSFVGVSYYISSSKVMKTQYELTGRYALDNYLTNIQKYSPTNLKELLPSSYVAQEWDYANDSELRQSFINSICAYTDFKYPEVQSINKRKEPMITDSGERLMQQSDMTNGELLSLTLVDYDKLSATMKEDITLIQKMYTDSGYSPTDYNYNYAMTDLMINYLLSKSNLPTKTIDIQVPLIGATVSIQDNSGKTISKLAYNLVDDSKLDDILFASESFHKMCDTFSTVSTGNTLIIPYIWIGANYCQNIVKTTSKTGGIVAQEGNGSFERPAGIGTTIITKAVDVSGSFQDVKVTLRKALFGVDAIKYAVGFSEKNRGFDSSSIVELTCFEIEVENLMSYPITIQSDMCLVDAQSNQSARSGYMYGFTGDVTIEPGKSTIIQDWATSTEMNRKYVAWGKTFNRQAKLVVFKLLLGNTDK